MIESVPGVCGGEPVIKGTRISCGFLYRLFRELGKSVPEIQADYPHLKPEDIEEAIVYAREHPEIQQEEEND